MKHSVASPEHLVDRRSFIRNAAAASAAIGAVPHVLSAAETQASVKWKPAPCRLCGVGCGLLVGIQGGRAVAVKGDPDHPVNQGTACVKGYYAIQSLYARDRITSALVRRGDALVPTSMPAALDLVAARMRETIQRHGADSVALYGSAQWSADDALIAARLFRGAIGSRNVDTSARLHGAAADYGLQTTYGLPGSPGNFEDLDHADVFVLWDLNMAETDPVLFSRILERRRVNPAARIIDLGTRTTRTSYAADRALLFAPQSSIAIANAICQEIIARRGVNRDFVSRHVAFKRSSVDGATASADSLSVERVTDAEWNDFVSFLDDYTPERAQRVSGLSAADIRWLASLYADPARRVVSLWGDGVNRQHDGAWANNTLHNIHLLVGKVASPGNGALVVSTQPGGTALLDDLMGHSLTRDDSTRARLGQIWGRQADTIDARPAATALSIFRALERGEIRFLWIQASNPMLSLPNVGRFRAAAKRGAFIVVSEAYPTATTDVADVVLPAAVWIERDAITVNGERRIEFTEQMIAPPGDSMGDGQQLIEVARRLGHAAQFPSDSSSVASTAWETITQSRLEDALVLPAITTLRAGSAQWPSPDAKQTRWRYNAAHDPAADKDRGVDFYGHADHRAWIWLRPWEAAPSAPDRELPFWLSTGPVVEHWGTGTLTRRIPTLHRAIPRSYVEMHREDARQLGIRDRDTVRLTSRRGAMEAEVRIDYRGQPPRGRLFVPSFDENLAVNLLTPDDACPVSGQIRENGCAVRVTRVRGPA
jgi:nitrate reductase NapA